MPEATVSDTTVNVSIQIIAARTTNRRLRNHMLALTPREPAAILRRPQGIATKGGQVTPIATGLMNAGLLVGVNGNVVWVDPVDQALSSTVSPSVMTACVIP